MYFGEISYLFFCLMEYFLVVIFFLSLLFGQTTSLFMLGLPVYAHDAVLVVLLVYYLVTYQKRKRKSPRLAVPILVFTGAGLISLFANLPRFGLPIISISALYLVRWVSYTFIYVFVLESTLSTGSWLKGIFLTGMGFSILGIIQFFLYPDLRNLSYLGWDPYFFRLFSTLFDPNFTGILLIFTIFVGLFLLSRKRQMWVTCGIGINMIALLLTFSRSSYVAFFVGLFVYGFLQRQWKMLFIFLTFVGLTIIIPKPAYEAFRLTREISAFARVGNWEQSISLAQESPIVGFGFNSLPFIRSIPGIETSLIPGISSRISRSGAGIDNSLLFVLVTTGLVGLASYLWLLKKMIALGVDKKKELQAIFLASLTAVLIHSFFSNSLFYPWVVIWIWILVGVVEKS